MPSACRKRGPDVVLVALACLGVIRPARAFADDPVAAPAEANPPQPASPPRRHRPTRADLPDRLADHDTSDGRVDGDLGLVVGLGATLSGQTPRGTVDLRLRYLDTAGLFAAYEDGFGSGASDPRRVLATGLEVRPLFLARWVTGRELGLTWPDLVLDSFGLELGAFFEQAPAGSFGARHGLQASLGLELPLFARVDGLWVGVHGGARWADEALAGAPIHGPSDRGGFVTVTLAYHRLVATHLVDLHDAPP